MLFICDNEKFNRSSHLCVDSFVYAVTSRLFKMISFIATAIAKYLLPEVEKDNRMTVFYLCYLFSLRLIEEIESFLMHMRSKNRTKICDVLLLISVLRIGSQHSFVVCFFVLKSFFTQDRAIFANALSLQSVQIYLTGDSI